MMFPFLLLVETMDFDNERAYHSDDASQTDEVFGERMSGNMPSTVKLRSGSFKLFFGSQSLWMFATLILHGSPHDKSGLGMGPGVASTRL
jgi:hypothetical protein